MPAGVALDAAMTRAVLAMLLGFNAGFIDTTGYLGIDGLFTAHVTGNFVTLGAALAFGTHGVVNKLLALPEFMAMVALAHVAGVALARRGRPVLRTLLVVEGMLLAGFGALAIACGPFPASDAPAALLTAFVAIAAMATQSAVQRSYLPGLAPTTIMTGNTVQAVLDALDLVHGGDPVQRAVVRARFVGIVRAIACFVGGCAAAALLFVTAGFWGLVLPVLVGAVAALYPVED